ncbi:MAG: SDR family NAD(P)-dependent oxidoreductase [Ktedonobacterales bacterium]
MSQPRPVAVITGASQGIGRRTAEVLAERGYRLALNDLREPRDTLDALALPTSDAIPLVGDVSDEQTVQRMVQTVLSHFGQIDVLVNNAGISFIAPAETITADQWRRVLDVNLTGPFLLSQAFGRHMLAQGSGSVVNVASIAGLLGIADRAAYNTSKHGLIGLTRTLAAEWGGRGVRVNAVCPGWVKTEMDERDMGSGAYTDADITSRVPMSRFATPDDIARAIAFLADPHESAFINGHTLSVDGGWFADGSWDSLRLRKR